MPASRIACITALTPKTKIEPIHMLKMMHHIHAKTCITRCRVLVSGMYDSGFRRLSITKLYRLTILSLRPFVMSDNNRSTLKKGKSNTKVKVIKIRYIAPIPSITYPDWDYFSVLQGLQQAVHPKIFPRGKEGPRWHPTVNIIHSEVVHLSPNLA